MARTDSVVLRFNTGVVDKKKLPRTDLALLQFAAETQTNFLSSVTGEMFMRPGFEYEGATAESGKARLWGYYKGPDENAVLEFTDELMRVWVDDELVTRSSVTSSITSGDFTSGTGWTLSGGAAVNTTTEKLEMKATAKGVAGVATQEVSTSSTGVEHALRIVVVSGPVYFRVGSSNGADDYVEDTPLYPGTHSIAFTPSGSYWLTFKVEYDSYFSDPKYVDSIAVESSGVMEITTPWAVEDLGLLRFDQSLDVIFVAGRGYRQKRIERRGDTSWSVVDYQVTDGPYSLVRPKEVGMSMVSYISAPEVPGANALQSFFPYFTAGHVGAIFKFYTKGTPKFAVLGTENQFTDTIRVTGVNATNYNDRDWQYTVTGLSAGTMRVQRSFDGPDEGFTDFREATGGSTTDITGNVTDEDNEDDDDNAIVWYRIGFKGGEYTSGTPGVQIVYDGNLDSVIVRVISVISASAVNVEFIYNQIGNPGGSGVNGPLLTKEDDWVELEWSPANGFPSAVAFHDGRLGWAGRDKFWLSVSDAYDSFDAGVAGDSGPINRTIAVGGSNDAQWMLSLNELIIGTNISTVSVKASTQGEILTPTDASVKPVAGSIGCAPVSPVRIGNEGMFVDASGIALYLLTTNGASYAIRELSKLTTELFASGIVEMAYQRRPDPRVWIVTTDGDLICCLYDPLNEVVGFFKCETGGVVESVTAIPGTTQDSVYVSVKRTINSSTVRYVEKMALDTETKPDTLCKCMDSFVVATASGTTLTVGSHLEGETVVVWSNGGPILDSNDDPQTFTVSSGDITVPAAYADMECVAGLQYTARYKSGRLGYGVEGYNALVKNKRLVSLGLLMTDFVRTGVKFGGEFDDANHPLDPLRAERNGMTADAIVLDDVQDEDPFSVDAGTTLDSRLCMEVKSPNTAKFLAINMGIEV